MSRVNDQDTETLASALVNNADFPWDEFDSGEYLRHNYEDLHPADSTILELVRDFFAATIADEDREGADVGTGTNLYPALAMLPYCRRITLVEHSARNRSWLAEEINNHGASWDQFWDILRRHRRYEMINEPRRMLADRAIIRAGSVYDLEPAAWDLGTIFFVAESITTQRAEFDLALNRFVRALRPGAPFAAAFMENSDGYRVGGFDYPAVKVGYADVRDCLSTWTTDLDVHRIPLSLTPLRDGYSGMLLALGRAGSTL
jgi:NNMT/PNMT/TEMT family